jgi:pSer/pThr/pTyr-binding forkhead associated (FHA) protein
VIGVFCNQCGHRNPPGSNFCSSCGGALELVAEEHTVSFLAVEGTEGSAEEDLTVHLEGIPDGMGLVIVRRGPNAGSKFVLEADLTRAGRHPASDIFLDDITVSRRHAEFVHEGDHYTVRDVGSLNGTYVNRERADAAMLANGDEVQIGKFKLVFLARTAEG